MANLTYPAPYWIIVSDDGTSTKPKHHETFSSANDEAIRLSVQHPGLTFTVFKSVQQTYTTKPQKPSTLTTPHFEPSVPKTHPFVDSYFDYVPKWNFNYQSPHYKGQW